MRAVSWTGPQTIRGHLPVVDRGSLARTVLAVCLVFIVLLGGTERASVITVVRAVGAIIGGAFILAYIRRLPRQCDRTDRLILGALVAFLASCVVSGMPRMSFDAALTVTATAAAFYVARGVLAEAAARNLAVMVMGALGAFLAVLFLILWVVVWLRWVAVPGAGLPPLSLYLPPGLYGHHYTVAMLIALMLPAVASLARRPVLWPVGIVGSVASIGVIVMSGSRTVWLALAVVGGFVMVNRVRQRARWTYGGPAGAALAIATVALGFLVSGPLLQRLGAVSSLELRFVMWQSALGGWLQRPIAGAGPNTFAAEFSRTGYNDFVDNYVPHAHNTLVQALFESGLLGGVAIALVVVAVWVGLRSIRGAAVVPLMGVGLFAVMTATEHPAGVGALVAPLVVWLAMAAPRIAKEPVRTNNAGLVRFRLLLLAVIATATAVTLVGSVLYDRALAAARRADLQEVVESLSGAAAVDPSFALYHRELAGALAATGRSEEAIEQVRIATSLHPADKAARRLHAVLALTVGNRSEALDAAASARKGATKHLENTITLAYVARELGHSDAFQAAATDAVRHAPWILAAPEWEILFPGSSQADLIRAAAKAWQTAGGHSTRNARERAWLNAMSGGVDPQSTDLPTTLEAAVLSCDAELAMLTVRRLEATAATRVSALQARLMFGRQFGPADVAPIMTLMDLANRELGVLAAGGARGQLPGWDAGREIHLYHRRPMPQVFGPRLPTAASGLSRWLLDPARAADTGAPDSGLASCTPTTAAAAQ